MFNAIVLAGGHATRLRPTTLALSKHLLPVYDKPMIYYPLGLIQQLGEVIERVTIITRPHDQPAFRAVVDPLKLPVTWATQAHAAGIAQALTIARDHGAPARPTLLILGDNLIHGSNIGWRVKMDLACAFSTARATIFATPVAHPSAYGVVTFDAEGNPAELVEKPTDPRSPYAVPGLYVYPSDCFERAATLSPSARGELEITDLNRSYLAESRLIVHRLDEGHVWFDMGTPDSLLEASHYVQSYQRRTGLTIGAKA